MQKRCGEAGKAPEMGHKDDQNLENLPCEERLREQDFVSLERRQLWSIILYQHLKGGYN